MPLKVLLTGAAGVLGRAVAPHLVQAGYAVTCHDAKPAIGDLDGLPGVDWVTGDIGDIAGLQALFAARRFDCVVHLAAVVAAAGNANPPHAVHVNVGGFANVLEAARLHGCRGVVYASSRSVYGNVSKSHAHPHYRLVRETVECRPAATYPATKRCAELIASRYAEDFGLPVVILRFGAIYGPGKSPNHGATRVFSEAIEAAAEGRHYRIGGGDQREDFVYSGDLPRAVAAALALIDSEPHRARPIICNIGSGVGVSIAEFARTVERLTGNTLEVLPGTGVMGRDYRQSFVMSDRRARTVLQYKPGFSLEGGISHYVSMLRTRNAASNSIDER